ncbi:hypothetical protein KNP414_03054 [Paenibacillus mucilaginosus KNP414]|uniref:Uncharacterized protein n=1 Tax=Paenibacillus mucilaginosus (strain KNP414) TaxID=1036673 RepID=F8F8M4_PAEMK|nr:hypothetical protein KNP414_03054 [Paenibacillus mucilaginosus KNP414]
MVIAQFVETCFNVLNKALTFKIHLIIIHQSAVNRNRT